MSSVRVPHATRNTLHGKRLSLIARSGVSEGNAPSLHSIRAIKITAAHGDLPGREIPCMAQVFWVQVQGLGLDPLGGSGLGSSGGSGLRWLGGSAGGELPV